MFPSLKICPNGLLCFGSPYTNFQSLETNSGHYCLAAYFEDLNPRVGGEIYYNFYDYTGDVDVEANDVYRIVKDLVDDKYKINFQPAFILKTTWDRVVPFRHYCGEVNF